MDKNRGDGLNIDAVIRSLIFKAISIRESHRHKELHNVTRHTWELLEMAPIAKPSRLQAYKVTPHRRLHDTYYKLYWASLELSSLSLSFNFLS